MQNLRRGSGYVGLVLFALVGCGDDDGAGGPDAYGSEGADASSDGDETPDAGERGDGGESCPDLPEPPGDVVIDLGDEGLSPGDAIDPYLEDHVQDGHQVRIPEGVYEWSGDGFTGKTLADASVVGEGEVVFDGGDGHEFSSNFTPEGGDFELRNIEFRGQRGSDNVLRVYVPDPDASLTFRNLQIADGSEEDGGSGIFVNRAHAGTFYAIDVHIEGFADNGLYASSPAQDPETGNGEVHVVRGFYRNNNISNVRIGTDRSSVRGAVIIQDEPAPPTNDAVNQRGLRVRQHETGDDIEIENVDITQREGGNGALVVEAGDDEGGGSGTINDIRVENDTSNAPVRIRIDDAVWSGSDLDLTGEGETEPTGGDFEEVCEGEGCDSPRTTPRDRC